MADAEQILRKLLDKIAAEQNYTDPDITVKQFTTEAANFSSFLFEVTISARDKNDLNLFAKVAAAGETLRSQAPAKVYEVEGYFYTELLAKYRKLERDHNLEEKDRLIVPKFYGFHPTMYEETIVLDNLASEGFTTYERLEPITWEYASKASTELAKLHALSFAFAHEHPDQFQESLKTLKFEWAMDPSQMTVFFESMVQKSLDLTKEEYKPRFSQYLSNITMESMMKFFKPENNLMLRHGDFRASNLMHRYEEDGSLTVVPIDYQTLQPGEPLTDLFYLVFTGTTEQFRARHWTQLLDHYYTELRAALTRLGLDPDEAYSRETFERSVKETMPYGIIVSLTILPLVLVEHASAPALSKDTDMDSFMRMQAGARLAERLNGILSDYIQWGLM